MPQDVKRAVVLMNLGSPASTDVKDVRNYLKEFLMDERVIDTPFLLRYFLVKGIIAPTRAPKSAHAYSKIWTAEGSPLIVISRQLQAELQKKVTEPVEIAMRYGLPSPKTAFDNIMAKQPDVEEVILVPMYPHYAMSSYETAVVQAEEIHKKGKYPFRITTIKPYYNEAHYIDAMAENIRPYLQEEHDLVLFSYHGIPQRHIRKSDTTGKHCLNSPDCCEVSSPAHATCYRHQCFTTTRLVTEKLGIPKDKYAISFQSRLGKEWLTPYTDFRLAELPGEGVKKLLILCPAFVSDCLETLEEIAMQGKETFMNAGGESYTMIHCMNTLPQWVDTIATWTRQIATNDRSMVFEK